MMRFGREAGAARLRPRVSVAKLIRISSESRSVGLPTVPVRLSTITVNSPTPPPNPTAAKPRDGRVLSRPSSCVHEPSTSTRSGCPVVTDGLDRFRESQILLRRVGGGHPHFHPHAGCRQPVIVGAITLPAVLLPDGPGSLESGSGASPGGSAKGGALGACGGDNTGAQPVSDAAILYISAADLGRPRNH